MKNKFQFAMTLAVILAMVFNSLALADSISGDTDALALAVPHANNLSATQNGGTTASYDFSAVINNTGSTSNDVFPGTVVVTITRAGGWLAGGSPSSFSFTAYATPQVGTVSITVPCGSAGTVMTTAVDLQAGTSSNGKSLSPDSVHLSYTITAGPDDPSCAPTNTPPTVDAGGSYSGTEGSAIGLDATVTDDDTPSLAWTYSTVTADAGTSCSFSDASVEDPTFTCNDDGTFTVTLTADDGVNAPVSDSADVTLSNANPVIDSISNSGAIFEGSSATINVTAHDPGSNDTLSYSYDCNNDSVYESASNSCSFADNVGSPFTVGVQVTDDDGGSATGSTQVTVNNANPVVAAPTWQSASVSCRKPATLTGISFSDAGVVDDPWHVNIDWGDGSLDTDYNTNTQGAQADQPHTYNAPGTYTALVTVTDKDLGSGSNSSSLLTVNQTYTLDFLPPFDDSTPSGLIVNKMKYGRVVPVKVTIYDDCALSYVTDPSAGVTIKVTKTAGTGTGDDIEQYADAGQSSGNTNAFRWTSDPAVVGGGFWIYNLDSKALTLIVNNLYRVDVYVGLVKATVNNWAVLQPVK